MKAKGSNDGYPVRELVNMILFVFEIVGKYVDVKYT